MTRRHEVIPSSISQPFWDAVDREELVIQRCAVCRSYQFYPRERCLQCGADDPEWVTVSGQGSIYSVTNVQTGDETYDLALVDLAEGPRMLTRIVGGNRPAETGLDVEVSFETLRTSDRRLPVFKVADVS